MSKVINAGDIKVGQEGLSETYKCSNYSFNLSTVIVDNIIYPNIDFIGSTQTGSFANYAVKIEQIDGKTLNVEILPNNTAETRVVQIVGNSGDVFPNLTFNQKGSSSNPPSEVGQMIWKSSVPTYFIEGRYGPNMSYGGKFLMECINYASPYIESIDIDGERQTISDSHSFESAGFTVNIDGATVRIADESVNTNNNIPKTITIGAKDQRSIIEI